MKVKVYIISAYMSRGLYTQDRRHVNPILKNGVTLIVVIIVAYTGCQNSHKIVWGPPVPRVSVQLDTIAKINALHVSILL